MSIPRSIPSYYLVKVQGKPGAGKTFILCTTCNMTRDVFGKMDYDMATVKTGVAADITAKAPRLPHTQNCPNSPQPTLANSPCRRRRPLCDVLLGSSILYLMMIP
jgi:hypothetical protein